MLELLLIVLIIMGWAALRRQREINVKLDTLRDIQFRQVIQDNEIRQRLIWADANLGEYFSLNLTEQNELTKIYVPSVSHFGFPNVSKDAFLGRDDPRIRTPHNWKEGGHGIPRTERHYRNDDDEDDDAE